MQKGFAPILILVGILVIALVGGGAYYFGTKKAPAQQTSQPVTAPEPMTQQLPTSPVPDASPVPTGIDETANWKTYTNSIGKYEFKYPENIQLTEVGYNRGEFVILQIKSNEGIQIDIRTKPEISLDDWLKKHNQSSGFDILSSKELLVDGVRAIQIHTSSIGMGGEREEGNSVYMIANGRLFQIANGSTEEILNKILSTFKFTQ